jgi:hypothetical protein
MKRFAVLLAALLVLSFPALAGSGAPLMAKPAEVGQYVKASKPYGQGELHKLFFHVYDSALWTDAPTWSMKSPFALTIRYRLNIPGKELVKRTFQEMARTNPLTPAERRLFGPQLARFFPDVRPGDTITAVYLPRRGAVFYYNGGRKGMLTDPAFARRFFNIWLGPGTSEPELRADLLAAR